MTKIEWIVPVAVPAMEVISLNHRATWHAVHRQSVAIFDRGFLAVRGRPHPQFEHATCDVYVRYPLPERRRDVANYMGTVKPLIDGMVQARLLPDDDDRHLVGPFLRPWPERDLYPDLDEKCGKEWLKLAPTIPWFRFGFYFTGQGRW